MACTWLWVAATLWSAASARADDGRGGGPWHVDLDVAYGQTSVHFLQAMDVVPVACTGSCEPRDFNLHTVRGTAGLGVGTFTLEGSVDVPVDEGDATAVAPFIVWGAGVRLDASWDGWLSMHFRFAYIRRWGALPGAGGRAGVAILIRPWRWLTGYGELSADVTGVPGAMSDNGTLLSYATFMGVGVRLSFGS